MERKQEERGVQGPGCNLRSDGDPVHWSGRHSMGCLFYQVSTV